jgi:hypothetical protein
LRIGRRAVLTARQQVFVILLVSGALGFRIGVASFADWQVAVETAQVVARLVEYPSATPFYVYHTKLWTILHQILAGALLAGVSERTLSVIVSGMLGMLSFQALSLITFAFCRDVLLAIGVAPLVLFTRIAEVGAIYPIWLMGTSHTYGILGLSYAALVAGFLGAGWPRIGLFLLGTAPAVHPSLGVWLVVLAAAAAAWDREFLVSTFRPAGRWFVAGCAVTMASFGAQYAFTYDAPPIEADAARRYLAAFVSFWDGHRRPVHLRSDGLAVNIAAVVAASAWLATSREVIPRSAQFLLRFAIVAGAFSLALAAVSWIPPDRLPLSLVILMPGRVLNLNGLMFTSMLVGVLGAYSPALWSRTLLLILFGGLIVANRSLFPGAQASLSSMVILVLTTLACCAAGWRVSQRQGSVLSTIPSTLVQVATLVTLVWVGRAAWKLPAPGPFTFFDRTNDPLFQKLSNERGLLLTGGDVHLMQLRTRRPVLLDGGGLDGLPYSLEAAPQTDRILREVYSVDLFNPPAEARLAGVVPTRLNKAAWESFTEERWQAIARDYGVTQVVTPQRWNLKLPVSGQNRSVTVYDIPQTRQ